MSLRVSTSRPLIWACSGLMYNGVPIIWAKFVKDVRDVGMVHDRQRLPLGLEARDHLARVHARLDDLQGNLATHRLGLLGHEDDAEAAFADLLQELVRTNHRASVFRGRWLIDR